MSLFSGFLSVRNFLIQNKNYVYNFKTNLHYDGKKFQLRKIGKCYILI